MRTVHLRSHGIKVDNDDGRFCLVVETEYGEDDEMLLQIDIHDDVLSFWENLRSTIGRYAAEADSARRSMPQRVTVAVEDVYAAIDAGYALDDPKSPGYHDRMVEAENLSFDEGAECEHAASELGEPGIV